MKKIFYFIIIIFSLLSCEKYDTKIDKPEEEPTLTLFTFKTSNNTTLHEDVTGRIDHENNNIEIIINYDIKTTTLYPTIILNEGSTCNIQNGEGIDITKENSLIIKNGSQEKKYTLTFLINKYTNITAIKVNGVTSYYNKKSHTFYSPLDKKLWKGNVNIEIFGSGIDKFKIGSKETTYGDSYEYNVKIGEEIDIEAIGSTKIATKLIITGLPIIVLNCEADMDWLTKSEKTECNIKVISPDSKIKTKEYFGGIKLRGNSSSSYEKKSLSLELRDKETNLKKDAKFLGMRSDDDWILDAMFMEQLRMRNRIGHEIWRDMFTPKYIDKEPNARSYARGEMAELYYNDEYYGIYCISEKIDRKQLNSKEQGGYIFKAEGWTNEACFRNIEDNWEGNPEKHFNGWQAIYPKEPYNINPLINIIDFVVNSDYEKGKESTFGKEIGKKFDIDNLVDYFLYINIISGSDNTGRNSFISVYNSASSLESENKYIYSPWDLDATFGITWRYGRLEADDYIFCFENMYTPDEITYGNDLFAKIAKYDIGNFGAKVKSRWAEIRKGVANDNNLIKRFDDYYKMFNDCKAYDREIKRWEETYNYTQGYSFKLEFDPKGEIDYIRTWIPKRMSYIDNYISNWETNASKIIIGN